jgi:hypothetical protein
MESGGQVVISQKIERILIIRDGFVMFKEERLIQQ